MDAFPFLDTMDAFPFLDLPKDLRLIVYDQLITRTHHNVTVRFLGRERVSVTLVQPDSITPVHLTCKSLRDEASTFLKAKLTRMRIARTTPRMTIHAEQMHSLFHQDGILAGLLRSIEVGVDGGETSVEAVWHTMLHNHQAIEIQPSEANVDAISSFLTATVKYLKSETDRDSWMVEAIKRAEDLQTTDGVDELEAVEMVHPTSSETHGLSWREVDGTEHLCH
jgi:hypothetical protein